MFCWRKRSSAQLHGNDIRRPKQTGIQPAASLAEPVTPALLRTKSAFRNFIAKKQPRCLKNPSNNGAACLDNTPDTAASVLRSSNISLFQKMSVSEACKPSSVIGGHLSRPIVTDGFKRNPESIDGPSQTLFRFLLRVGFTSRTSRQAAGELLPHLSTLTRLAACGISLLHFPWGRPRRVLPGTLPYAARTFLTPLRRAAARQPHKRRNYSTNPAVCQRRDHLLISPESVCRSSRIRQTRRRNAPYPSRQRRAACCSRRSGLRARG